MKAMFAMFTVLFLMMTAAPGAAQRTAKGASGEALFRAHCSACHPGGGNILNPQKTLRGDHLAENGITSVDDIVKKIRNPDAFSTHPSQWSGMKMFDESTIPDADARKIAEYILATFK